MDMNNEKHRINNDGIIEKLCSKCNQWKVMETEFYAHKSFKLDGYNPSCKECVKARQRARFEFTKPYHEKWMDDNKEKVTEYNKKYYPEHIEEFQEKLKNWQKENPERVKYHRLKKRTHKISKKEWADCKKYFDNACAYCGLPIELHSMIYRGEERRSDFHKEHVDDNGLDDLSNCIPSCRNCNSKKGSCSLDEWYNQENILWSNEMYQKIINWITADYKKYIKST